MLTAGTKIYKKPVAELYEYENAENLSTDLSGTEKPQNPFDKDGDGYIDGWY